MIEFFKLVLTYLIIDFLFIALSFIHHKDNKLMKSLFKYIALTTLGILLVVILLKNNKHNT